jgi:hypothetical protein
MIVFDLKCANGHVFEAWFGSSDSFEKQRTGDLLLCAVCNSRVIEKAPMAANLPTKANTSSRAPIINENQNVSNEGGPSATEMKAFLSAVAAAQKAVLKDSKWVGRDFDKQARAMDGGEVAKEIIHGEVTPEQASQLIDDGIAVMPLPLPIVPPEQQN